MKKSKTKEQVPKLEQRIYVLPNNDKGFHEHWHDIQNRSLMNVPWPFRMCLISVPGGGKTNTILNLILQASPEYKQIILIHPDEHSQEYKSVDAVVRKDIPPPDEWNVMTRFGEIKTLVVIDDIELKLLDKKQQSNLARLFGYVSTHCGVSVIITAQDGYSIPVSVRRCISNYVIWKAPDRQSISGLLRKAGLGPEHVKKIFRECLLTRHDNFMVDLTVGSPAMYRRNIFEVIPESFFDD